MIVCVLLLEIQEWRKLESASCLCGVLLFYNLCTTILVKLGEAGDYECPAGMSVEDVSAVVSNHRHILDRHSTLQPQAHPRQTFHTEKAIDCTQVRDRVVRGCGRSLRSKLHILCTAVIVNCVCVCVFGKGALG